MECPGRPIGTAEGQHVAQQHLAVSPFDTGFDPGLFVDQHHQASLVVQAPEPHPDPDGRRDAAIDFSGKDVAAMPGEAVVRLPPEVGAQSVTTANPSGRKAHAVGSSIHWHRSNMLTSIPSAAAT